MANILDSANFLEVVKLTPLVSIDLVITNKAGEVLLGLRVNEPAKNTWFVPGGRICKDERIEEAFGRISETELGIRLDISGARPLGVFQHLYDSNFTETPGISTHYIVLAYALQLDLPVERLPMDQHQACRWWPEAELLAAGDVHPNTKAYFS
jgi:colanic acid biosynthesis protein WcaH